MQLIFFLFNYIYQKISDCVIMILILGLMRVHCEEKFHFEADRGYLLTYPIEKAHLR